MNILSIFILDKVDKITSFFSYGMMGDHVLRQVIHDFQVRMDQLIIELYFVFSELMVMGVCFGYELSV